MGLRRTAAVAVLLAVPVVVFLVRLGASAVPSWDEGTHAIVTHEIVREGDWLNLRYQGSDYFRKPPLSFWVRAVAERAFGESEWTIRIASALAGIGTAGVLALWAYRVRRRWLDAAFTVAVLVSGRFAVEHAFRSGETDGLLGLLTAIALYLLYRSLTAPSLLPAGAAFVGLAAMTKQGVGLLPFAVLGVVLLWERRWPYRWKHVLLAALLFLALAAPWHLYQTAAHGSAFWEEYAGLHVVERFTDRFEGLAEGRGPLWYFSALPREMAPWSILLPFALLAVLAAAQPRWRLPFPGVGVAADATEARFLLAAILVPFALLSVAATKHPWYLLPVYLPAALLLGRFIGGMVRAPVFGRFKPAVVAAVVLGLLAAGALTVRRVVRVEESPYRLFARSVGPGATVYSFDVRNVFQKSAQYYLNTVGERHLVPLNGNTDALAELPGGAFVIAHERPGLAEGARYERLLRSEGLALYRVR